MKSVVFCFVLVFGILAVHQGIAQANPSFTFGNGIGVVAPDSTFSLNFRFRMQNRVAYSTVSKNDFSASTIEARVRRMRLRFEGFVVNPKINYYVQLSFSRADMDWSARDVSNINTSPNVVRDAVIFYKPNSNLTLAFGQTKLPGNRQRVVSSGEQQFAERSIVNSTFNIDRDFGVQAAYQNDISGVVYVLKGAVSSGEGRNSSTSDAGLAYTGRVELLPFGKFTNKGDYFEGDLEREPKPKLSIAAGYHYNESAQRTAGTIGRDLYTLLNLESFIADVLLKYNGFAFSAEYITRATDMPITVNQLAQERVVYVGDGKMTQLSYIFPNNLEIAGRYAVVTPERSIYGKENHREEAGLGVTKYLKKHRVKLQSNLFLMSEKDLAINQSVTNWLAMFQIELGI